MTLLKNLLIDAIEMLCLALFLGAIMAWSIILTSL